MTIVPGSPQGSRRQRRSTSWVLALITVVVLLAAGTTYWLSRGSGNGRASAAVSPTGRSQPVAEQVPKSTAAAPETAGSAQATLAKVLAAATAAQWVHLEVRDTSKAHAVSYSDDSGPTTGTQSIVFDGARSSVRLVDRVAYFTGDKTSLIHYYQFTQVLAAQLAGRWLRLSPGDPGYDSVSGGITIADTLHEMSMPGPLRLLPTVTRNGRRVFGITGQPAGTHVPANASATLWVAADGSMLPVEYVAVSGATRMHVTMSRWAHAVDVVAPESATTLRFKTNV